MSSNYYVLLQDSRRYSWIHDPVYSCSLDSGCMTGAHCFQITGDVCSIFSDCNNLNISFLPVNTYILYTYIYTIYMYVLCVYRQYNMYLEILKRPVKTRPDQT
jgi:hypothetical protein